jgi:transcription initiation factor TFIIIB Brf1 subunit/transcription initiation factor TFIIB
MSRYLLELALVSNKMIKFRSSNLAASAIYLSMKMTKTPNPWNDTIAKHSQYKEQDIRPCAKELFSLLQIDQ